MLLVLFIHLLAKNLNLKVVILSSVEIDTQKRIPLNTRMWISMMREREISINQSC